MLFDERSNLRFTRKMKIPESTVWEILGAWQEVDGSQRDLRHGDVQHLEKRGTESYDQWAAAGFKDTELGAE